MTTDLLQLEPSIASDEQSADATAPSGDRSDSLKRLATRGAISLVVRQLVAFGSSFVGGILLARILSPSEFGAYAYMTFVQGLARLIVDGGLTATLVRQPEAPTERDWRSVFTLQVLVSLGLAGAVVTLPIGFPVFAGVPGFGAANALAAGSIVVAPMLSVGFARLERALRFDRIGLLTLVQPLSFSVIGPILAALGFGVVALGAAMLASNVIALIVALPFTGRLPRPAVSMTGLRSRLRFGLPYISAGMISTVKDAVNPLLVGVVVGAAAVGYIRWSAQLAALCTYIVAGIGPMLFALFARVQQEPARLGRAVSLALFWANAVTAPLAVLLTLFIVPFTENLYGSKWLPAVPLYLLLALTNLISPTTTVLLALCNALGRPRVPLIFSCLWFAGTWIFTGLLVATHGAMGFAIANALVQVIGLALIVVAQRIVRFRLAKSLLLPWGLTVVAAVPAAVVALALREVPVGLMLALGVVTVAIFAGLTRIAAPREFSAVSEVLLTRRRRRVL